MLTTSRVYRLAAVHAIRATSMPPLRAARGGVGPFPTTTRTTSRPNSPCWTSCGSSCPAVSRTPSRPRAAVIRTRSGRGAAGNRWSRHPRDGALPASRRRAEAHRPARLPVGPVRAPTRRNRVREPFLPAGTRPARRNARPACHRNDVPKARALLLVLAGRVLLVPVRHPVGAARRASPSAGQHAGRLPRRLGAKVRNHGHAEARRNHRRVVRRQVASRQRAVRLPPGARRPGVSHPAAGQHHHRTSSRARRAGNRHRLDVVRGTTRAERRGRLDRRSGYDGAYARRPALPDVRPLPGVPDLARQRERDLLVRRGDFLDVGPAALG